MKFCMKCMAQYDDALRVCPECGFAEGTLPDNSRCIEPGVVLADRYIMGMPLNIDGWFIKYIGWDALTNKTVTIYEYCPARFSSRNIGDQNITVIKEKEFYKYMDTFLKKSQILAELHLPDNVSAVYETFEKNKTAYVITEYVKGKSLSEHLEEKGALSPQLTEQMFLPILRSIDELHESGFFIGGFSIHDLLVLDDGTLFLNSYLENILFNVTDDLSDIKQKDKQKYYPIERLRSFDSPELLPSNDVYSAALIMHRMMGVELPEAEARSAYFEKTHKDKLKALGAYHIRVDKDKENALRNASYVDSSFRTPDMETFIKELSGEKKVVLRTNKNKGFPLWAKIAIPVACAAVIAGIVLAVVLNKGEETPPVAETTDTLNSEMTVVPSIVNLNAGAAESKLAQFGLLIELSGKEINDELEAGTVISQTVEKGSMVEKNTVVGVTVSAKSGLITMPNFLGLDSKDVIPVVENLKLSYSVKESYSRSIGKGCISSQSITPYDEVTTDRRLDLVVSLGPDPSEEVKEVEVGDHVGKTYDELVRDAENDGTPVEVVKKVYDDTKPEGTVLTQYPPAQSRQNSDQPVQVEVTTAQKEQILPDVTLLDQKRAESILALFGIETVVKNEPSDNVAEGLVATQSPAAGQKVPTGSKVTLTVSQGKASVSMPNVVGQQLENAVKLITDAGISARLTYTADTTKPDNEIVAQSVEAGAEVKRGMTVVLTVNAAGQIAEIPDVTGMRSEDAKAKLEEAGFVMKVYVSDDYNVTEGKVYTQAPGAGILAKKESEITVLLMAYTGEETESSVPDTDSSEGDIFDSSLEAPDSKDIVLSPESISVKVGDEFILLIKCIGIENLAAVDYELSEQGIIEEIYIDKQTLDMTFRAVQPGTVAITISAEGISSMCFVEVTE